MSLPKFIKVCQALNTTQCVDLKRYMLYHINVSSELYVLLELVIKHQTKINNANDVDVFAKKYLPNCSKKTFLNYLSQLYAFSEHWISHQQLEVDENNKAVLVQKWLNKNGLYEVSDQLVKKTMKRINDDDKLDLLNEKYKSEIFFEHFFSNNPVKYEMNFDEYKSMIDSFATYASSMNYLFLSELDSWQKISHKNVNELKLKLHNQLYDSIGGEISMITKQLCQLLMHDDFESFLFLKDLLLANRFNKSSKLHHIIAANVIRRSAMFWTKGRHSNAKMVTDLTIYGLENGVFLSNGKLFAATFHNIIFQLSVANTFDFMLSFIGQWIEKVNTQNKEATYHLSLGQLCFYFEKYDEVIKNVWRNDFDTFGQKRIANDLYLLSTFSDKSCDEDMFIMAMQNSYLFYKRNKGKMSKHIYDGNMNLIKFLKALKKCNDFTTINMEAFKPLPYRSWCEKILLKK